MRKSYRRHCKRSKRKNTRRRSRRSRRGGVNGDEKTNNPIFVEGNVRETVPGAVNIDEHYNKGYEAAQKQLSNFSDFYTRNIQNPLKNKMKTAQGYTDTYKESYQAGVDDMNKMANQAQKKFIAEKNKLAEKNLSKIQGFNELASSSQRYMNKMANQAQEKFIEEKNKLAKDNLPIIEGFNAAARSSKRYMNKIANQAQDKMKSPMGFSSLSSNKPNKNELDHAREQGPIGTPMQNDPYNQRQLYLP